jgi:hypothetical protein
MSFSSLNTSVKPTCDNAIDFYTEGACDATFKEFNPKLPRDGISPPIPTCIPMNKYNFETVMARYQNSIPSCVTLRARYAKYREYYD